MNNKKRYAIGFYNNEERINSSEWAEYAGNRLITYVYDNQDKFNMRYKSSDEEGNRTWFILEPKELEKAKEYFAEDKEVIERIDTCNDYDKWKTSCECCDSISINMIPYTYREYGGCVGRAYNCAFCSGLPNRLAHKVAREYEDNGVESAIDLIIAMSKGEYVDNEGKYYCGCCENDLRRVGFIENGEYILSRNHEGKFNKMTIDEYNDREKQFEQEIEGYYPNFYPTEFMSQKRKVNGYRCFECNCEVEEDVVNELLGLKENA